MLINLNEHQSGNIFSSENSSIPKFFFAMPKKPSLLISNSLEFTKSNEGNPSRNDFKGQSFINAFNKFDAKIIINIIFVQGVHTIIFALENNEFFAKQIAEVFILLPKKEGEKSAKTAYKIQDGLFGYLL